MTQINLKRVLLNDCEKSKKKRKNCDIKFTELYIRLPDENVWDLLKKDEKFLRMLNKNLNKVTKQVEYQITVDDEGIHSCFFHWVEGRTYSLSELLKVRRTHKNIEVAGPIRLLNILLEKEQEKIMEEDLEMLPNKRLKLESEYLDAKDKLWAIKGEIQESLNQVIELEEKKISLLKENKFKTELIKEFEKREKFIANRERKIKLKEEELEARESVIQKEELKVNKLINYLFHSTTQE